MTVLVALMHGYWALIHRLATHVTAFHALRQPLALYRKR